MGSAGLEGRRELLSSKTSKTILLSTCMARAGGYCARLLIARKRCRPAPCHPRSQHHTKHVPCTFQ